MKPGTVFRNQEMQFTVLGYSESTKHNCALIICHNDGLFITVRDLTKMKADNQYFWYYGHYFIDLNNALSDFRERIKSL